MIKILLSDLPFKTTMSVNNASVNVNVKKNITMPNSTYPKRNKIADILS